MTLRIYFGDLTHATIGLATETFPLNVGYVAGYCQSRFGHQVEIRLFKYIDQLDAAIVKDPPDILALSNYHWNLNADLAMFRRLAGRRPEALRVMGGPNFPQVPDLQREFLTSRPLIDAHVFLDGEVGFSNIVRLVLDTGNVRDARSAFKEQAVEGCVQLNGDGDLGCTPLPIRLVELDVIPSPYLTGLMDPFFDGQLAPMIQTNRGCPFKCTFCSDGSDLVNRVTRFSFERVQREIAYIVERVPPHIRSLYVSDLNFGMDKRDAEICNELSVAKSRHNYPQYVVCTTGKNSKRRVISAIERLEGALDLSMSVQSLTPSVLKNVKRDNIRVDDFLALKPAISRAKLPTSSEVILGLPGETKRSHFDTLGNLLDLEVDYVIAYTLILVNGAELATPAQRAKWGFQTRFRVITGDFTALENGDRLVETEEVVVGSNTLSFEDYLECRKMALMIALINSPAFRPFLHFLVQNGVRLINLLERMLATIDGVLPVDDSPVGAVARLFREFVDETKAELWDRPDDIVAFFQDPEHFQGLVDGRYGLNLLHTFRARGIVGRFNGLADLLFSHARVKLEQCAGSDRLEEMADQLERYCRGRAHNLLGDDRLMTVPQIRLSYDVDSWLADPDQRLLSEFSWGLDRSVSFVLSAEQHHLVEEGLSRFGESEAGQSRFLTSREIRESTFDRLDINPNSLWRRAVIADTEFS